MFPRRQPVYLYAAARGLYESEYVTDCRRLAAAVRTYEPDHFALLYRQVFVEYSPAVTVVFGKVFYFDYVVTHLSAPPKSLSSL